MKKLLSCLYLGLLLLPTVFAQSNTTDSADSASGSSGGADFLQSIDDGFGVLVGYMAKVLFFKIGDFPFVVLLLGVGGVIFTFAYLFINIRLFGHGIRCVMGKYDNPEDEGEISHFKALTSALSATVGLGNIAGVAVAIAAGGPGAVFWMWIVAFFGMTMKFNSCTLAQLYRRIDSNGKVLGGPMVYLDDGIRSVVPSLGWLGKIFGILFALLCILGSFGGGNLFQGHMTFKVADAVIAPDSPWSSMVGLGFGIVMALLVGLVIIGGIKRIGSVTSKLVPAMCIFYCGVCLIIIISNIGDVPAMFASIFQQAFKPDALFVGGFTGVLLQGMKRAAFSNEAGLGSAAIAHSAAKTKEPVREGVVAMLGPFIDTIIVCTMTALAILLTVETAELKAGSWVEGATMMTTAFGTVASFMPMLLIVAVAIFAFSTMISWSYYGERCAEYLFGSKAILPYRIVFTILVALGPVCSLTNVLDFSDMALLSMGFPNIIGMLILTPITMKLAKDYLRRLKSGEIKPYK